MRQRAFSVIFLGALLWAFHACNPREEQLPPASPNIVFIFTDDHAFQAISAYGGRLQDIAPTPNIDRLAREGMIFNRCYVTNSICAPSRAVIQTGKYSHLNGVPTNGDVFDGNQQTFPKLLQQAAYQTALIGKWHLKSTPQGFDYFDVLPGQGHYYNPDFINAEGRYQEQGYVTDIITDKALGWLDSVRGEGQPFMLMIQHKAPHREWEPKPEHVAAWDGVTFPEPDNLFDDYRNRGTAAKVQDMTLKETMRIEKDLKMWADTTDPTYTRTFGRMDARQRAAWNAVYEPKIKAYQEKNPQGEELIRWKYQRYMEDYLACIRSVDENIGRVLDYLDQNGLSENTLVVYASDQGFYLGEHGWFDKRFMYEESFRTPLLARWPGKITPGSVNHDLVSNIDFAPTFLTVAGAGVPEDMQGKSLEPIFKGEKPADWRESLYYHYYEFPGVHDVHRHEGVVKGPHKLMYFYALDEWELYDLNKDPHEMNSVYEEPDYEPVISELKEELQKLREELEVPENELYEVSR